MARRLVGGADCDDVVQEAYLKAIELRPAGASGGWLATAVRHRGLDRLRRRRRRQDHEHRVAERAESLDAGQIARRLELHRNLAGAIQGLRADYRQVLYLRYFEDLGPVVIAARLGLPVKTVKTRLFRALEELRGVLRSRYGAGEDGWVAALAPFAAVDPRPPVGVGAGVTAFTFGAIAMSKKMIGAACVALGALGMWLLPPDPVTLVVAQPDTSPGEGVIGGVTDSALERDPLSRFRTVAALPSASGSAGVPAATAGVVPSETGALAVRVVGPSGQAVPGVAIGFEIARSGLPRDGVRRVVSDSEGLARADGLPAGAMFLGSDRGGGLRAEVLAGETTDLVYELGSDGIRVTGTVLDASGRPVAGAGIWLCVGNRTDWLGGRVVAQASEEGRFSIGHVPPDQSLGAIASGFAPSALIDIGLLEKTAPVDIELRLVAPGGSVVGHVFSPDGAPVAGAQVGLGSPPARFGSRGGVDTAERWTPRVGETDENGAFAFVGIAPGEYDVSVAAAGLPEGVDVVRVEIGATSELDVHLQLPVVVEGVVRDEDGAPIPLALVRAFVALIDETFLQAGQFDHVSTFGYPSAGNGRARSLSLDPADPGNDLPLRHHSLRFGRRLVGQVHCLSRTGGVAGGYAPMGSSAFGRSDDCRRRELRGWYADGWRVRDSAA